MAVRSDIIVGLDIGNTKVAAVIGQMREHGVEVIGVGQHPSHGLRKGVIINIDATVESVTRAVEKAEIMAGEDVERVYVGIAGPHVQGINTRGMVAIPSRSREISAEDVARAVRAAKAVAIPADREVIHLFNQEFKVDDQDGIRDPVGMAGSRLEVEVHLVTAGVTALENLRKTLTRAGLGVEHIVLQSFASALACLSEEEKDLGVLLVDMGGGTTDLLMYINGGIWYSGGLAVGGNNITNDISIGLRTPVTVAEEIKRRHAVATAAAVKEDTVFTIPPLPGKEPRECRVSELTAIVEPRVAEMFAMVRKEVDLTGFGDLLSAGAVLTGGASLLRGQVEAAERILGLPVRLGAATNLRDLTGQLADPAFATAAGLVIYGSRFAQEADGRGPVGEGGGFREGVARFVRWLKEYF